MQAEVLSWDLNKHAKLLLNICATVMRFTDFKNTFETSDLLIAGLRSQLLGT